MFKMKYEIKKKYLPLGTPGKKCRRQGKKMTDCLFIVAHDTGNPKSTALNNVSYYTDSFYDDWAAAHIFVDDNEIIECIPWLTVEDKKMEKANHVLYNVPGDNEMYGHDSNDYAGGIELCYGGKIDPIEAYKRYVWVTAYACYKHGLDPAKKIVGHYTLDPKRKTDPKSGLFKSLGITFEQYIKDVVNEYRDCTIVEGEEKMVEDLKKEIEQLKKEIAEIKSMMVMEEVPSFAKVSVDKAVKMKIINTSKGNSYDFNRMLVVLDRAGVLGNK